MARNIGNSNVKTALESRKVRTCHLYEFTVFDSVNNESESIYGTDNSYDIIHDGKIYVAVGFLLEITGLEEFNDSRISQITLQLSGVSQQLIATILSYEYMDQPVIIKRAFLDEDNATSSATTSDDEETTPALIDDPVIIFEGGAERPQIIESQSDGYIVVSIQASSRFSEFLLNSGRHTNPKEQQFYDPSDRFFDQVGKISKNLVWGLDE